MKTFLIIGTATDGPTNTPIYIPDQATAITAFGGLEAQTFSVSGSATGVSLLHNVFDFVSDRVGNRSKRLYNPQISGTTYSFGNTGEDFSLITQYTPYLGKSDLLAAVRHHLEVSQNPVYALRFPGERASLTLDDWVFKARYDGEKYNNITITVSGSTLVVSGMQPEYPSCTYDMSDLDDFKQNMQVDFGLGICPAVWTRYGGSAPTGSGQLSGGGDGVVSGSGLMQIVDQVDLPIDAAGIVFLGSFDNEVVEAAETLALNLQPRIVFCGSVPGDSTIPNNVAMAATGEPYRHNMVVSVQGDVEYQYETTSKTRYAVEALCAAMSKYDAVNFTNLPLKVKTTTPILTEAELDYIFSAGFVGLTRRIRNGIVPYRAVTTRGADDFYVSLLAADVRAKTGPYLHSFMGTYLPEGSQPQIVEELYRYMAEYTDFQVDEILAEVYSDYNVPFEYRDGNPDFYIGRLLSVLIRGTVFNEIVSINFTVRSRV